MSEPLRIRVDFNLHDATERLLARRSRIGAVVVGERVHAFDADGNSVTAVVEEIGEHLVFLAPVWETWQDHPSIDPVEEAV